MSGFSSYNIFVVSFPQINAMIGIRTILKKINFFHFFLYFCLGKYCFNIDTFLYITMTTKSQILTIGQILEGVHAKDFKATLLYVDLSKAFDFILRGKTEQILLTYRLPRETIATIMMLYKNMKVKVHSQDGYTDFFSIV